MSLPANLTCVRVRLDSNALADFSTFSGARGQHGPPEKGYVNADADSDKTTSPADFSCDNSPEASSHNGDLDLDELECGIVGFEGNPRDMSLSEDIVPSSDAANTNEDGEVVVELPECYLCLCRDSEDLSPLISPPCMCNGTLAVHESCFKQELLSSERSHCSVCHRLYRTVTLKVTIKERAITMLTKIGNNWPRVFVYGILILVGLGIQSIYQQVMWLVVWGALALYWLYSSVLMGSKTYTEIDYSNTLIEGSGSPASSASAPSPQPVVTNVSPAPAVSTLVAGRFASAITRLGSFATIIPTGGGGEAEPEAGMQQEEEVRGAHIVVVS